MSSQEVTVVAQHLSSEVTGAEVMTLLAQLGEEYGLVLQAAITVSDGHVLVFQPMMATSTPDDTPFDSGFSVL